MTKFVQNDLTEEETDSLIENMADDDYILVIGSDGILKSLVMPVDDNQEMPETLAKILNMMNMPSSLGQTLH